jgi:hypothetical protein
LGYEYESVGTMGKRNGERIKLVKKKKEEKGRKEEKERRKKEEDDKRKGRSRRRKGGKGGSNRRQCSCVALKLWKVKVKKNNHPGLFTAMVL